MDTENTQQIPYLVDESRIEERHDQIILGNPALLDHVDIINKALDFISRLIVLYPHRNDDELIALRLAIRCFNSGAAGLRLLRCGYYQPSISMVRDIVETTFLLDLFHREPQQIAAWRTLPARQREERFKPVKVRERLDELDGFQERQRAAAYKLLSTYAAHPTPEGFVIISPDNMTQVGPFPDEKRLVAGLQELSKHLTYAALNVGSHVDSNDLEVLSVKAFFLNAANKWRNKYMANADVSPES